MCSKHVGFTVIILFIFFNNGDSSFISTQFSNTALSNEVPENFTTQCILRVMKNHLPCNTRVTVAYLKNDIANFIKVLNQDNCFTVIVRSVKDYSWFAQTTAYMILIENPLEISNLMTITIQNILWNPKAPLVVLTNNWTQRKIKKIFDVLLRHRVYYAILLNINVNDADIYTYFPFDNGNCGRKYDKVEKIANCNQITNNDIFPKEDLGLLRNCTVKVIVTEDVPNIIIEQDKKSRNSVKVSGVEDCLLSILAEAAGVRLKYEVHDVNDSFGNVLPNRTVTGILSHIYDNTADIAAGGFLLIKNRADVFAFIVYSFSRLQVFTAAIDEPIWKQLYEEFDNTTWISILLFFSVTAIICSFLLKISSFQGFTDVILKLWGFLYIGNSSSILLKNIKLRPTMACWIWLTFFLSNFYTTALYSLVTARVKQTNYIIPEHLEKLSLKPCISDAFQRYFLFAYNHSLPKTVPIHECKYSDTSLDVVASRKNLFTIEMSYTYSIRQNDFVDADGNNKLDAWDFSIANMLTLYLARGFPLQHNFWKNSKHVFESGILNHYLDYKLYQTKSAIRKKRLFKKIRLLDLKNHYFVLIFGLFASTLCFIIELLLKRR